MHHGILNFLELDYYQYELVNTPDSLINIL
jgi:hypothetical protein